MKINFKFGLVSSIGIMGILLSCDNPKINFKDFENKEALTLNGEAAKINDKSNKILHLTNDYWQSGSAFISKPLVLKNKFSFSTYFQFRINNARGLGDGADGIAFVLQSMDDKVGATGGGIGYMGIVPSVAVEFDTYHNGGDPNGNHVGINVNGNTKSVRSQVVEQRFDTGVVWNAWVDYNGEKNILEVRVSQNTKRPSAPVIAQLIDLKSLLQKDSVYVGLSSGTGAGAGNHDILSWRFDTNYKPHKEDLKIDYSISIVSDYKKTLPIGGLYKVVVEAEGSDLGDQLIVNTQIGSKKMDCLVTKLKHKDLTDETGPWVYESKLIEVFPGTTFNPGNRLISNYADKKQEIAISGITRPALVELLEHYIKQAALANTEMEALSYLEKVFVLLISLDDALLYSQISEQITSQTVRNLGVKNLLSSYAEDFKATANSKLNQQLRDHLDKVAPKMMKGRAQNTSDKRTRRAYALLKETALLNAMNQLKELNVWKKGNGKIGKGAFMNFDERKALKKIRRIRDEDQIESFLQTNGIANGDRQVAKLRQDAISYMKKNQDELERLWAQMVKAKEWYIWASKQLTLFFKWKQSIDKYARQYQQAEHRYKQLLSGYDLLRTLVENNNGDEVPLWKVIADSGSQDEIQSYFDASISNREKSIYSMAKELVEMRDVAKLSALGGPKYKEIQDLASTYNMPVAGRLVNLAKSNYQLDASESQFTSMAVDFGIGAAQVFGTICPPVFYAATTVAIGRESGKVVALYQEMESASKSEAAHMGSSLYASDASTNFTNSLGGLGLELAFSYVDYKAMKSIRAYRQLGNQSLTLAQRKEITKTIKSNWEAERTFHFRIAELTEDLKRYQAMAANKKAVISDWDRKIKEALKKGDEPLRNKRMAKRANDQRILISHWHRLIKNTEVKLAKLKRTGPKYGKGIPIETIHGQDVERAAKLFYSRLAEIYPDYVQKLRKNRFQFGEMIEGTVDGIPKRRYEVRLNGRITDINGKTIKPPQTVQVTGEAKPVKNPHANRKSMEFDRIIIDHKAGNKSIYLEDLIRTGNRKHLIKTHSYVEGLKEMFPGYRIIGVDDLKVPGWPKDVVWGKMKSPISAISKDMRKYKIQKGVELPRE